MYPPLLPLLFSKLRGYARNLINAELSREGITASRPGSASLGRNRQVAPQGSRSITQWAPPPLLLLLTSI